MIRILFSFVNRVYGIYPSIGNILFKINKLIVNLLYPPIQLFSRKKGIDESSEVIVSLTTFPERINYVWMTVLTLLNQTQKPCQVVLWLAAEQFPDKHLPWLLRRLCKRGLEIRYCDDLKSNKKYFYTMKEWPDNYVITCDDDMFYPETLIAELWECGQKHPGKIICNNSLRVTYDEKGEFIRRDHWVHEYKEMEGLQVCPVGCGGVLYPKGSLHEEVFHKEVLTETALCQDDIWLKGMGVLNATPAYNQGKYYRDFFNNIFTQKSGLWKTNIGYAAGEYSANEISWMKMIGRYPLIEERLKEDHRKEKKNG